MKKLVFVLILVSRVCFAGLGGTVDSVNVDRQTLHAANLKSETSASYSVHQFSTTTVIVKEFTNAQGQVFAVTWRGAGRPDLTSLFGSYYQEYSTADAGRPKMMGRRSVLLKTDHLVVSRGGHMRDIHGKAYVPSLVPAGVDAGGL